MHPEIERRIGGGRLGDLAKPRARHHDRAASHGACMRQFEIGPVAAMAHREVVDMQDDGFFDPQPRGEAHPTLRGNVAAQAAIACPISGPESSWMKWLPVTVTSVWLGQCRQNSRGAPVRIAPGVALTNNFGKSFCAIHSA